MRISLRSWLSALRHVALTLQPFSARRRKASLWEITKRLVQAQDNPESSDLLWALLQGKVDAVTFRRDGLTWTAPVHSWIARELLDRGGYHAKELHQLLRWLPNNLPDWRSRGIIVNVGANIGDTCIPLALQTEKRLIACEPVPDTFEFLHRNVVANKLEDRIRCRQFAVSATPGTVTMVLPDDPGQSEVEGRDGKQGYAGRHYRRGKVVVPAATLDSLVAGEEARPEDVALVWSDTQGYESDVLESGKDLWRSGTPAWVEVWPAGLNGHGGIARFLDVCGRHFKQFLASQQLRDDNAHPRDIQELPGFVQAITGVEYTDVLLLPSVGASLANKTSAR